MTNNTVTKNNINFHNLIDIFDAAEKALNFIINTLEEMKARVASESEILIREKIKEMQNLLQNLQYRYQTIDDEQNLHRGAPLVFRN
jgi:predicted RNA-binding protein with EMAP domain